MSARAFILSTVTGVASSLLTGTVQRGRKCIGDNAIKREVHVEVLCLLLLVIVDRFMSAGKSECSICAVQYCRYC